MSHSSRSRTTSARVPATRRSRCGTLAPVSAFRRCYGHGNACNSVAFSLRGDTIASTDADGIVKLWDVRMVQESASGDASAFPANGCCFDPSGKFLAVASDDGSVKMFDTQTMTVAHELTGHEDCVQAVAFDPRGQFLVSAGSDSTFRVFGRLSALPASRSAGATLR
eukprot:EC685079.1.p1 GENE.EC685079.1~~EC685079.1.p1  ORF type:complete len:167 (+),score=32.18 EC685079.1:27-527(+)